MNGDARWQARKDLFHSALALPPAERAQFLAERSPDAELRAEVERLLRDSSTDVTDAVVDLLGPGAAEMPTTRQTGDRVGPYRIEGILGEGGMGVVYKATDTRLGRIVVLKFLHPREASTPERISRFLLEAKAASALNHPGIVTIFEADETGGASFIAMEFVEGQTLQQLRRERGALQPKDAIEYSIQLADAMAAAHQQGILHRDLKPANVMVNTRGQIKILDFGLAKVLPGSQQLSPQEITRTYLDAPHTKTGMIIGSIRYMSPEQARGAALDHRSDIFSLGSVLYEMFTGAPPFKGASDVEVLGEILHVEPLSPGSLNGAVPEGVDAIVARCLHKDPAKRFPDMAAVKTAFETIRDAMRAGSSQNTTRAFALPSPAVSKFGSKSILVIAATAAVLTAMGGLVWFQKSAVAPPPKKVSLTRLVSEAGVNSDPAISPDGKFLVYASDRSGQNNTDLWLMQVGSNSDPIRLTHSAEDESEPHFSPDGTKIVYHSDRAGGGVYLSPLLGRAERLIAPKGRRPRFSPDGKSVVYWKGQSFWTASEHCEIWIQSLDSGDPPRRFVPDFDSASVPVWSPKGDRILFLGRKSKSRSTEGWWVASAMGNSSATAEKWEYKVLYRAVTPFYWLDKRVIATVSNIPGGDEIVEFLLDQSGARLLGNGYRRLSEGTLNEESPSINADGSSVVFSAINENRDIYSARLAVESGLGAGPLKRLTSDAVEDLIHSISKDGERAAVTREANTARHVWTMDLAAGKRYEITRLGHAKYNIRLSLDGKHVAFRQSLPENEGKLYLAPFEGGEIRELCSQCGNALVWFPDSRRILTSGRFGAAGFHTIDVDSKSVTDFGTEEAVAGLTPVEITEDGLWLSASASGPEGGQFLIPLRDGGLSARQDWVFVPLPKAVAAAARLSPAGQVLYYPDNSDAKLCLWAQRLDAKTKRPNGKPFPVLHFHSPGLRLTGRQGDPQSEGFAIRAGRIVFNLAERSGNIWMIE